MRTCEIRKYSFTLIFIIFPVYINDEVDNNKQINIKTSLQIYKYKYKEKGQAAHSSNLENTFLPTFASPPRS